MEIEEFTDPTTYTPESATNVPNSNWFNSATFNDQLFYCPDNAVLGRIVGNVSDQLGFKKPVIGFNSSLDLLNSAQIDNPFASVEFDDNLRVRRHYVYHLPLITFRTDER